MEYTQIFIVLGLFHLTIQGAPYDPERRFACWGGFGPPVISAQCPRGTVIQVVQAGLKVRRGSPSCQYQDADCGCEYSAPGCNMPNVRELCMGRPACRLDVTQQYINTQDCRGFSDYMFIDFNCISMERTSVHDVCLTDVMVSQAGFLRSPNYPLSYPTNRYCMCNLRTLPGHTLHLSILDLSERADPGDCLHSRLSVRGPDNTQLFCASTDQKETRELNTDRSAISVVMETDEIETSGGFWLQYKAEPAATVQMECFGQFKKDNPAESPDIKLESIMEEARPPASSTLDIDTQLSQSGVDSLPPNEAPVIEIIDQDVETPTEVVEQSSAENAEGEEEEIMQTAEEINMVDDDQPVEESLVLPRDREILSKHSLDTVELVTDQTVAEDDSEAGDPAIYTHEEDDSVHDLQEFIRKIEKQDLASERNLENRQKDTQDSVVTVIPNPQEYDISNIEIPQNFETEFGRAPGLYGRDQNELSDNIQNERISPRVLPRDARENSDAPRGDGNRLAIEFRNKIQESFNRYGDNPQRQIEINPEHRHIQNEMNPIPPLRRLRQGHGQRQNRIPLHMISSSLQQNLETTTERMPWWWRYTIRDESRPMRPGSDRTRDQVLQHDRGFSEDLSHRRNQKPIINSEHQQRLDRSRHPPPQARDLEVPPPGLHPSVREPAEVPFPGPEPRLAADRPKFYHNPVGDGPVQNNQLSQPIDDRPAPVVDHIVRENPEESSADKQENTVSDTIAGHESMTVTMIVAGVIGCILLVIVIGVLIRFAMNRSDPRHALRQRHKKECVMRSHNKMQRNLARGSNLP